MKIEVLANKKIGDLQVEFNKAFPYLKLVFFKKPHNAYEGSPAKDLLNMPEVPLGEIAKKLRDGVLYLEENMPTWQVERLFEEEFGLHVQVFRKSGSIWLETSVTDDLTLEQQNAKGKQSDEYERNRNESDYTPEFREQD